MNVRFPAVVVRPAPSAQMFKGSRRVAGPAHFVAGVKDSVAALKRLEAVYPGLSITWSGVGYNRVTDLELGSVEVAGPKDGVDTVLGILNSMQTTRPAGRRVLVD